MDKRNVKVPCHKCPDRTPTCHAECEKYLEYAKIQEEKRQQRLIRNHAAEYMSEYRKKHAHRNTLQKKQKGSSIQ